MKKYGLIGYPLSHSFSKKYFTEKFLRESITEVSYELYPITEILELPSLLAEYPELLGLNVTIPFKEKVIPYLSDLSPVVEAIGACNCIKISEGKLVGYNTDVIGFEKSLKKKLKPRSRCFRNSFQRLISREKHFFWKLNQRKRNMEFPNQNRPILQNW